MPVFFTLPPHGVYWPWWLVNQFNVERHVGVLSNAVAVLLDSGVEKLFRRPDPPRTYPPGYEERWIRNTWLLAKLLPPDSACTRSGSDPRLCARVWAVLPDYPDDYVQVWGRRHALWVDGRDNIERTVENAAYYWDKYCRDPDGYLCVLPVQGYYEEPRSIGKSIKLYRQYGLLREAPVLGLANLCTTRKARMIAETIRYARMLAPQHWLHVFGPSLRAVFILAHATRRARTLYATETTVREQILKTLTRNLNDPTLLALAQTHAVLDSFDSTAWTFPRQAHRWSAKNQRERIQYFHEYIKRIKTELKIEPENTFNEIYSSSKQ